MMLKFMTYHDLLGFGEVVLWVAVELHFTQFGDWDNFLGNNLGRIEEIKSESKLIIFIHDLDAKLLNISILLKQISCKASLTSHSG